MITAIISAVAAIGGLFKTLFEFLMLRGYKKAGADEARLEDIAESRERARRASDARAAASGVRDKDFGNKR